jgi:hypothetical protein
MGKRLKMDWQIRWWGRGQVLLFDIPFLIDLLIVE